MYVYFSLFLYGLRTSLLIRCSDSGGVVEPETWKLGGVSEGRLKVNGVIRHWSGSCRTRTVVRTINGELSGLDCICRY